MAKTLTLTPKEKAKDQYLSRTYHITLAEYKAILKFQGGRCAICRKLPTDFKAGHDFATDHCHTTGLVRGLLCWGCNKSIAVFKDDETKLVAAAEYLAEPPVTALLGPRYTAPGKTGTKKRAKLLTKMKGDNASTKK